VVGAKENCPSVLSDPNCAILEPDAPVARGSWIMDDDEEEEEEEEDKVEDEDEGNLEVKPELILASGIVWKELEALRMVELQEEGSGSSLILDAAMPEGRLRAIYIKQLLSSPVTSLNHVAKSLLQLL
jgi:hypothetical protein